MSCDTDERPAVCCKQAVESQSSTQGDLWWLFLIVRSPELVGIREIRVKGVRGWSEVSWPSRFQGIGADGRTIPVLEKTPRRPLVARVQADHLPHVLLDLFPLAYDTE